MLNIVKLTKNENFKLGCGAFHTFISHMVVIDFSRVLDFYDYKNDWLKIDISYIFKK